MQGNAKKSLAPAFDWAATALDIIDDSIAVLDRYGTIIYTNQSWKDFARKNRSESGEMPKNTEVGANYLTVCQVASGPNSENAYKTYEGIQSVLDGRAKQFSCEYACHSPTQQRWFLLKAKPLPKSRPRKVLLIHVDITDRWLAEMEAGSKKEALGKALQKLQVAAEAIKANIGLPRQDATDYLPTWQSSIAPSTLIKNLSIREQQVLEGLVRGERNAEISDRLGISTKSVTTFRSRLLVKLNVRNNADLIKLVMRRH